MKPKSGVEVLIKVRAASVNPLDWRLMRVQYEECGHGPIDRRRPGH
jgi:NADPH:quinone reductase-like Zn-dependent oxidoreductase